MKRGFLPLFILGLAIKINADSYVNKSCTTPYCVWCKDPTDKDLNDLYSFIKKRYRMLPQYIPKFLTKNEDEKLANDCKKYINDSVVFMPEVCNKAIFEFLNDAYFWLQTFTKSVSIIKPSKKEESSKMAFENINELKEDQLESYYGLRALLRFILINAHYGIKISEKENEALTSVQTSNKEGSSSVIKFPYPLISAISHGGRIVTLIKKKDNAAEQAQNNFDKYISFFNDWFEHNGDNQNIKTTLYKRGWSSHGFSVITKNNDEVIREMHGTGESFKNKRSEMWAYFSKMTNDVITNTNLHYSFKVPFSGAGNRIFFQGEEGAVGRIVGNKKANCWKMDTYHDDIDSGHIYFRPYLEENTKKYLAFITGIESSTSGKNAAVGGTHNALSVLFPGEISLTMGRKWKDFPGISKTQKKANKESITQLVNHPIPHTEGGKVVVIDEDDKVNQKDIYKIADEVLEKLQTYPEGRKKEELKRRLWDFFLSEGHDANKKTLKALSICENSYKLTFESNEKDDENDEDIEIPDEDTPNNEGSAEISDTSNSKNSKVRILVCFYYYDCLSKDEKTYCNQFYEKVKNHQNAFSDAIHELSKNNNERNSMTVLITNLSKTRFEYDDLVQKNQEIVGDTIEDYDFFRITVFIYWSLTIETDQIKNKISQVKGPEDLNMDMFKEWVRPVENNNDLNQNNQPANSNDKDPLFAVFADAMDKINPKSNGDYVFMREYFDKNHRKEDHTNCISKLIENLKKILDDKEYLSFIENNKLVQPGTHKKIKNNFGYQLKLDNLIYKIFLQHFNKPFEHCEQFIVEMINPENYKTDHRDKSTVFTVQDKKRSKRTRLAI